jgi:hypothetical protein
MARGNKREDGDDARKDEDIREVMAQESRRGKRPLDPVGRKLEKQRLEAIRVILSIRREEDAVAAIRALGHGDDPDELERILKVWRAASSSRKK